jgi:hypothetical protein
VAERDPAPVPGLASRCPFARAAPAAFCRHCGYSLVGLPTGTCPECGHAFDLADRRTFAGRPPRLRLRCWGRRTAALLACLTLAIGSVPAWYGWRWLAEQKVIGEIRASGGTVTVARLAPGGLARWLPSRLAFLNDHARDVYAQDLTRDQLSRIELADLRRLRQLVLRSSAVDDAALAQLRGATELRQLVLPNAPLDGSGLCHLSECRQLTVLNLSGTRLNDQGVECLRPLLSLEVLLADDTMVSDTGMNPISSLASLHMLSLRRTRVTDAGLRELRGSTSRYLRDLSFSGTRVTQRGKDDLQAALPLIWFRK